MTDPQDGRADGRGDERPVEQADGRGPAGDDGAFLAAWREWRAEREAAVAAPHGFLAITGLHWLAPEPTRYPDAPGVWRDTGAEGVVVELAAGEELTVAGRRLTGRHAFGRVGERAPVHAAFGDRVLELARRGGQHVLRPRDPDHPARTGYTDTPTFDPDPAWALPGRFLPFAEPRAVTAGAVVPGLAHVFQARGRVEFELAGAPVRLTTFNGAGPGGLLVLFTDATTGVTTSRAGRTLAVEPPSPDGRLTVDLNRAANPPCAYTEHATCPLPPPENRLSVAVEAGELLPRRAAPGATA